MNAQKWVFAFFLGLMGIAAILFVVSLVENLQDGGPRELTVNAVRGLALIGVQVLFYAWVWRRRKQK